ncbi:uncharacterized protein LOC121246991 [Juglans microcarpa x Juglans regia]|uniref:uncharacterized protein LOC121246991 n=1 Tax=Juglans microcarpa x Juglans regia TaxID=2249226 RepID=UPI001B7F1352|nr:uncharacterized protein LOC121246991 [Juglans microcarpa x Juglans regia]
MNYHAHRILTPGSSRKRKEREVLYSLKPSAPATAAASKPGEPLSSNRLLAGYMAYEFLKKGTLFGQKFDPVRAEAVPLASSSAESKRWKPVAEAAAASLKKEHQSYAEVASILKTDGAHIPGVVNPTQLARWIQM